MAFIVVFCFPFALPVTAESMNYACLITGGFTIFVAAFWFWRQGEYVGPRLVEVGNAVLAKDAVQRPVTRSVHCVHARGRS